MTTTITDREPELHRVQHAALRVRSSGLEGAGYARRCKVETVNYADDFAVLGRAPAAEKVETANYAGDVAVLGRASGREGGNRQLRGRRRGAWPGAGGRECNLIPSRGSAAHPTEVGAEVMALE